MWNLPCKGSGILVDSIEHFRIPEVVAFQLYMTEKLNENPYKKMYSIQTNVWKKNMWWELI